MKRNGYCVAGYTVAREERNRPAEVYCEDHPAVKVVMLTNLVSDYYQKLCRKIGAVHFMDKSKTLSVSRLLSDCKEDIKITERD